MIMLCMFSATYRPQYFTLMNPSTLEPRHSYSLLGRESAPCPQLRPKEVQHKDATNAGRRQRRQDTRAWSYANANIHRPTEQHGSECERRASEIVAGEQTRCVLRVDQRQVYEYTLQEDKYADCEDKLGVHCQPDADIRPT